MDELDRMFRRLVQNIRAGYPEYLAGPFEVGELYQTLIPYRLNRRELGLETNQEYELTLMRLLSGERGYLSVDDALRETMGRELSSPNPDTSAFRAFNNSRVSLSVDVVRRLEQAAAAARPAADDARIANVAPAGSAVPAAAAVGAATSATAASRAPMSSAMPEARASSSDLGAARPMSDRGGAGASRSAGFAAAAPLSDLPPRTSTAVDRRASAAARPSTESNMASASRASTAGVVGGSCRYCGGTLPDGRRITFCPHCGQNLTIQHCPACSTELEIGWKFCTTCGRSVTAA